MLERIQRKGDHGRQAACHGAPGRMVVATGRCTIRPKSWPVSAWPRTEQKQERAAFGRGDTARYEVEVEGRSILVGADDFTKVAGTKGPPRGRRDGALDEMDGAISKTTIHAAGMVAGRRGAADRRDIVASPESRCGRWDRRCSCS